MKSSKSSPSLFRGQAFPCTITLSLLAAMPAAQAADSTWTGGTSILWATGANWSTAAPAGALTANADIATFNSATYSFAPTAVGNHFIGGLAFGSSNGAITITTGTGNSRLNVGSGGIQMASTSGAVILGAASAQGVNITANQNWTNDSTALLSNFRTSVDDVVSATTPDGTYTITFNGSGAGGFTNTNGVYDQNISVSATRRLAVIINTTGGATNFGNSSNYSGGTTLTAGLLQMSSASAGSAGLPTSSTLGTGSLALNGGTLSSGATNNRTVFNTTTIGGNVTLGDATNDGTLTFDTTVGLGAATRTLTTASNVVFAGVVSNGNIIKDGAGTLALNANSSTVGVTVNSGTLAGTGTAGATSIATGNLAIGAIAGGIGGLGTMNFSSLDLGSASTFTYQMTGGVAPGAGSADLGDIGGTLSINTSAILDLVELGTYTVGNKFTLFAYDGALSGNFSGLVNEATFQDDLLNFWQIKYDDTSSGLNGGAGTSFVTITAIPEPGAALLGGLGMLALLRRRRCA